MIKKLMISLKIILIFFVYSIIATAIAQDVLISEDFSNPSSDWDIFSDEDGSVAYQNGLLCIIDTNNVEKTTKSCINGYFSDLVIDVDTKLIGGSDDNWHVVYCRLDDLDNNYGFGISSDGYYAMDKWVDGERTWFIGPTESEYINVGIALTNHIHIECIGQELSFSVNGHLLGKATDSSHEAGSICLAARTLSGSLTEVAYDNFVLTKPE